MAFFSISQCQYNLLVLGRPHCHFNSLKAIKKIKFSHVKATQITFNAVCLTIRTPFQSIPHTHTHTHTHTHAHAHAHGRVRNPEHCEDRSYITHPGLYMHLFLESARLFGEPWTWHFDKRVILQALRGLCTVKDWIFTWMLALSGCPSSSSSTLR